MFDLLRISINSVKCPFGEAKIAGQQFRRARFLRMPRAAPSRSLFHLIPSALFVLLSHVEAAAPANNLVLLGERLIPAYTAMNYDSLCGMSSGWSSIEPHGARGSALFYAQDAKNEAIQALSYNEAVTVLRIAADAARAETRRQLRANVISDDKVAERGRLNEWCHGYASEFIHDFISTFDADHAFSGSKQGPAGSSPNLTVRNAIPPKTGSHSW